MTTEPEIPKSPLESLNTGLLMLNLKKEIEESAYSVIDQVTFGHNVIKSRQTYTGELVRVLDELKLTAELVEEVDEQRQSNRKVYEPEDLINYYSGNFFGLVHQAKDKLLRLIDYMAAEETQKQPYSEPEKISPGKLLKKHGDVIDKIGIRDLLEEWVQGDKPIGIVLKKRTQHHHFASKLQLNKDFLDVRMSKLMLVPLPTEQLSEYGKQYMIKLGTEAFSKLKKETVDKQAHAISVVETNINAIAEKLIAYYKIPATPQETAKIAVDYMDYLSSLKITNEASLDKTTPEAKEMTDELVKLGESMGDNVIAAYLVGSAARGEFVPGSSDINMYVVTKGITQIHDSEQPATLYVLSEEDFLSDEYKKARFICWSDGVLVMGKEYKFDRIDFPKPGTLLCLLLNRGVIERLEALRDEVAALKQPTSVQLRLYGLKASKIMLDYAFGVAMSNKPFYSASRKKKIAHIDEVFPSMPLTRTLEKIYNGVMISQKDICTLINAYLGNARKNYDKQIAMEQQISKG
jgi:predicted nucleotidyltransferase